ncbi:MAG: hypothetical protein ACRDRW_20720 [Pseudonocardiaceae bacterium]
MMMLGGRRLWLWMGLLLVVAAAVGGVAFVIVDFRTRGSAEALVSTLIAVATATVGAAGWLWRRAGLTRASWLPLERAVDELAEQLRRQWERAAAERGLTYPEPIGVRWRWSSQQVTGPRADAVGGRFAPLPGMAVVTVEDLRSGVLRDLLGVYGGLGSGRLVVLGEPGAGKSGAGIRLLLDALAHRATVLARDRVPVPVLVTPRGWDPAVEPFAEWLAGRLERDYALLRAPEYGADASARLIEGGHLAVILDGLDELPEALRPVALRALDEQVTFRLVVLTRTKELVVTVSGSAHLRGAAALELLPIDVPQAARYLASAQIDPPPAPWRHVIDHLREHPEGVVAQALTTPLMLTLLRDTYGPGQEVDELIDGRRFLTREAVEDHLLDRVLTAAYARHPGRPVPPYTVEQARRWLGQLARRMNEAGTRDLAWWRIPRWVPAWPRVFVTVIAISVISAFLIGPLAGLATHMHLLSEFPGGPLTALAATFNEILVYAFMFGLGLLLMSPPGGGPPQQWGRLRWSRTDILMIPLLGLGVGLAFGLERGFLLGLKTGLAAGLVSSFVIGLGFVLGGGPPQQLGWLRWSRTDTRTNLRTGLVVGLVTGLGYGLLYGFLFGLTYALIPGFIVGIGYLLVIVVGGRRSHERGRLRWNRTDTPTTLLIGLVIAIASQPSYGITYILIVILGGRVPLQRTRLRWSRIDTPTTLLTGLLSVLVLGLALALTSGLTSGLKPVYGVVLGLVFGLMVGLLGLRQPSTEATSPLNPRSLWRRERQSGLAVGLAVGLVLGVVLGVVDELAFGLAAGLVYGITDGLAIGLGSGLVSSATWTAALAGAQLWRQGEAPLRLLRFLEDARARQILRTVGPAYQFRHARLQDRLAENHPSPSP